MKAILDIASVTAKAGQALSKLNVQNAVHETAKDKRLEITEMLKGKRLSIMLDMATCMQRSFLGEFSFNFNFPSLTS